MAQIGDHPSKVRWEKENTIHAHVKVNRNQDAELYALLRDWEGSKGDLLRRMLNAAMTLKDWSEDN